MFKRIINYDNIFLTVQAAQNLSEAGDDKRAEEILKNMAEEILKEAANE